MAVEPKKPRNLLRLAGVINSANAETDNEAGALIDRVRSNQARALGLIAKGHQNEALREQMLSEAEKEEALADLTAAVGDNGGPLLDEPDEVTVKMRAQLEAAKSASISESSGKTVQPSPTSPVTEPPKTAPANPAPPLVAPAPLSASSVASAESGS